MFHIKNLVFIRVSNSPKLSDSLIAILVLSYFPCSDFPGLLVCDLHHVYTLKGTRLEAVESATYLGVDVTNDLTWNKQVHKAAAKGNRALGFIKRNVKTKSGVTKDLAYKSLVRPTLEYSSTVWSPHLRKLKKEVEKVQRRAARYVSNRYTPMDIPTEMMQSLKWETLEQRRLKSRVVMGYRIVHGLVGIHPDQLVSSISSTRGHDMKYNTIYGRTDYYRKTFFPSLIPLWNRLPSKVISATSLEDFKSKLADLHIKPPE